MTPHRIAVVALHPIQYQAGLWRTMASHPRLDVEVLYLDTMGVDGTIHPEHGVKLAWDLPLLEGYKHRFLRNLSRWRFHPIAGRINPSIVTALRSGNYDAVLFHGYLALSNWLGLLAAASRRSIILYRGEGSTMVPPSHPRWMTVPKLSANRIFLQTCDAIAYSSTDNREYQLSRGASDPQLFGMPCAVDNAMLTELAANARPPHEVRASFDIPADAPLLVSVGRFVEGKRMSDVIESLASEPVRALGTHLVLAGTGPLGPALEELARARGVFERVRFPGFISQQSLVETLLASDLLVMASSIDRSPKALSESLFLGLPVICSRSVGTCADLIREGENGFSYPCGDVDSLTAAVVEILSDGTRRRAMAEASRAIAQEHDFETSVASLVEMLDSASKRRQS